MKHIKIFETFLNEGDRSDANQKIKDLERKFKDLREKQKDTKEKMSDEEDPVKQELLTLTLQEQDLQRDLIEIKLKKLRILRNNM